MRMRSSDAILLGPWMAGVRPGVNHRYDHNTQPRQSEPDDTPLGLLHLGFPDTRMELTVLLENPFLSKTASRKPRNKKQVSGQTVGDHGLSEVNCRNQALAQACALCSPPMRDCECKRDLTSTTGFQFVCILSFPMCCPQRQRIYWQGNPGNPRRT